MFKIAPSEKRSFMKKISFNSAKVKKMLSGKGFFVALCLSLVAVIAAGFVAYRQTVDNISKTPSISSPTAETSSKWDFENANKPQDSVPKEDANATDNKLMIMPVNGDIINPFSNYELVPSKTVPDLFKTHNGTDIKAELGTQVKSMSTGKVTQVKDDALLGICVTIDHGNGVIANYCNLNKSLLVSEGSSVNAGTVIGSVGDTAISEKADGPHLHLEVLKNSKYIDPIEAINTNK